MIENIVWDIRKDKNFKIQPKRVNPYLWRRFLEIKGYNGSYTIMGITINVYHTKYGILERIG